MSVESRTIYEVTCDYCGETHRETGRDKQEAREVVAEFGWVFDAYGLDLCEACKVDGGSDVHG